jgi:kynurenine formamidase
VHLSHIIHPQIPLWPNDPAVEFVPVAEWTQAGYYLRRFSMGEHSATHVNAPKSFDPEGASIDRYAAESLVVPAIAINLCGPAAENPDYALTVADILAWEQQYGLIPADSVVLLYTGWQAKWSDAIAFFNIDASGQAHFPGFGAEATQFLLEQRQILGVGIDTHGVDPGIDLTFATNTQVLARSRLVLENLTNLDQIPPTGATLSIGILRLQNGSGSPAAVMALVP